MSQLTICRASAGSGKTYKLTKEFLKLLFQNPNNYRHILAVTFTNKATGEMKNRIIRELHNLAQGKVTPYMDFLKNEFDLSLPEIQNKAIFVLYRLLHDYSKFSVKTIDKFFQEVIRAFARETGLQAGYNLELDANKTLNEAIDKLMFSADSDEELREWLVNFASNKVEEGNSWDLKYNMLQLGREVFKETYKEFRNNLNVKLSDKAFVSSYLKDLILIKTRFEDHLQDIGRKGLKIIENHSLLTDDFAYGKAGIAGYFIGLARKAKYEPGKRTLDCLDTPELWYSKTSKFIEQIKTIYNSGLNELLRESIQFYDKNVIHYNTADKVAGFVYTLGIITDITKKINEYTSEKNLFLISDSANLLKEIIGENDAPFIYEKTGHIYRYFMIDEFQDTSGIQWDNFKPLIENSLAEGRGNLLVGDVKQSIYRWRNSNWNILAEKVEEDFSHQSTITETLGFNWRSRKNIVDFNNSFFQQAADQLQQVFNNSINNNTLIHSELTQKIINAYRGLVQDLPENKENDGGYVRTIFIESNEELEWKETVLEKLPNLIEQIQQHGYSLKDIAVLVRSKSEGKLVADTMLNYKNSNSALPYCKYDVLSNESLFVRNSSAVQFTIAILKYLNNPGDNLNISFLLHEYQQYITSGQNKNGELHKLFTAHSDREKFKSILPASFIQQINRLKQLPLYELVENLIQVFELNKLLSDLPYLQAFQDIILDSANSETNDINSFLDWWTENESNKSLSLPDEQDAIRILTIHKSKGLEFKVTIVPFCDWSIDHAPNQTNIIWCKPQVEPFNKIDILPVKYSSSLVTTLFSDEYYDEKIQVFVDNLNLLYVAFTRAIDCLYVYAPFSGKDEIKNVSNLLKDIFSKNTELSGNDTRFINLNHYWDPESKNLEIGRVPEIEKHQSIVPNAIMDYISSPIHDRLKLKLRHNDFFNEIQTEKHEKADKGKLMHEIFQNIITVQDINNAVQKMIFEGKLSQDEAKELTPIITSYFNDSRITDWFDGSWTVKTENDILIPGGAVSRPDRVLIRDKTAIVIDYKFGKSKRSEYKEQIFHYINFVKEMSFENVKGFIWYVMLNEIEEV